MLLAPFLSTCARHIKGGIRELSLELLGWARGACPARCAKRTKRSPDAADLGPVSVNLKSTRASPLWPLLR
eukprot:7360682-Alexandrium_andersonii.AAC.1